MVSRPSFCFYRRVNGTLNKIPRYQPKPAIVKGHQGVGSQLGLGRKNGAIEGIFTALSLILESSVKLRAPSFKRNVYCKYILKLPAPGHYTSLNERCSCDVLLNVS